MLKKWFPLSFPEDSVPMNGNSRHAAAVAEPEPEPEKPAAPPPSVARADTGNYLGFEQIYGSSPVKPPRLAYGILKVADMVNSPHLAGLSPEAKRCSLLMALEAAAAEIEDLLQDAVVRQRALNDYEEGQGRRLQEYEAAKLEENSRIQAELDRLTSQYLARIQANLDDVAREQDKFRNWQREKHLESQRITEAAAFCVPQGSAASGATLSAILERASRGRS